MDGFKKGVIKWYDLAITRTWLLFKTWVPIMQSCILIQQVNSIINVLFKKQRRVNTGYRYSRSVKGKNPKINGDKNSIDWIVEFVNH